MNPEYQIVITWLLEAVENWKNFNSLYGRVVHKR